MRQILDPLFCKRDGIEEKEIEQWRINIPASSCHLNPSRLVAEHVVPCSQICAKPPSTNNSIPVT
jgi:hypothetical protein